MYLVRADGIGDPAMTYYQTRALLPEQEIELLKQVRAANLATFAATSRCFNPIPAACTAIEIDAKHWAAVASDCRHVLAAMRKCVAWLARPEQQALARRMYAELSPLEREVALDPRRLARPCATIRMDLFFGTHDLHIIEVNATIPAMQAYSDMIAEAYMAASKQPFHYISNTRQLLTSLLEHAGVNGQRTATIGIVSRPLDSQSAELQWYQRHWQALGYKVILATPDELHWQARRLLVGDQALDFCYRHIFASRLQPGEAFYQACEGSDDVQVYNPVAAHMEIKALLAILSRGACDEDLRAAIALTAAEVEAISRRVPWTRLIENAQHLVPGEQTPRDLCAWVKANPEQLVIKSSSGYGGHRVIIGSLADSAAVQQQMGEIAGRAAPMTWLEFVEWCCLAKTGLWIVQQKVPGLNLQHRFIDRDDQVKTAKSFIDCSIFLNEGVTTQVNGPVIRFAPELVVNIGRGGGIMPVFIGR